MPSARMVLWSLLLIPCSLLILSEKAVAATHFMTPGGTGDGSSWEQPASNIQSVLNTALPGDELWVAGGTYHQTLQLVDGVALYGGFGATETVRSQRDWHSHPTILDADGLGGRVVTVNDVEATTLDGFTLRGGSTSTHGAGIAYLSVSSGILANCVITENTTTVYGGGLYNDSSTTTLLDCVFSNNTAKRGGGIYCLKTPPSFQRCTIDNNRSEDGGGLYCYDHSSPTMNLCVITDNTATLHGGGFYGSSSSPPMTNCTIAGNNAGEAGGFFCLSSSPKLVNCIVWNQGLEVLSGMAILVSNTCIQGGYAGAGNIETDPLFLDLPGGDYRLQDHSPCIDRGVPKGLPFNGSAPDLGAFETPPSYSQAPPRAAMAWHVDSQAAPGGDGKTWGSAFREVSIPWWLMTSGDEVWVATGTYRETVVLQDAVVDLFGGFSGNETMRNQRDWQAYPTCLDADGFLRTVVTVVEIEGITIDGFTLTGGNTDQSGGGISFTSVVSATLSHCVISGNSAASGGGIHCLSSSPAITRCTITRNQAENGGGISLFKSTSTLRHCTICDNSAQSGSAAYSDYSSPVLVNSIFWNPGGEIVYVQSRAPKVTFSCIQGGYSGAGNIDTDPGFENLLQGDFRLADQSACIDAGTGLGLPFNGSAPDMGAWESPANYSPGLPRPPSVWFVDRDAAPGGDGTSWAQAWNTASYPWWAVLSGDEVWVAQGLYQEALNLLDVGVSFYGGFQGNESQRTQRNPAVHQTIFDASGLNSPVVRVIDIEGTTLDGFTLTNGSADQGGGVFFNQVANGTVADCKILHNRAAKGGGVGCQASSPVLKNCMIAMNQAQAEGGGVYLAGFSKPKLTNCTLADNSASFGSGMLALSSSPVLTNCIVWNQGANLVAEDSSFPEITYSCIEGGFTGTGNIVADPLFVSPSGLDYHLKPASPCLSSGIGPALSTQVPNQDLDGLARMGDTCSMGVYEYLLVLPTPTPTGTATSQPTLTFTPVELPGGIDPGHILLYR